MNEILTTYLAHLYNCLLLPLASLAVFQWYNFSCSKTVSGPLHLQSLPPGMLFFLKTSSFHQSVSASNVTPLKTLSLTIWSKEFSLITLLYFLQSKYHFLKLASYSFLLSPISPIRVEAASGQSLISPCISVAHAPVSASK